MKGVSWKLETLPVGERELAVCGASERSLVGAVELVDEVFGDAFEVGTRFFYRWTPFFVARHPWLPVEVKARGKAGRPR